MNPVLVRICLVDETRDGTIYTSKPESANNLVSEALCSGHLVAVDEPSPDDNVQKSVLSFGRKINFSPALFEMP